MYVTHQGATYQASERGALLHLEPTEPNPPMFICAVCGAGADTAEKIPHKPSCPEYRAPVRQSA